jgi:hypothetical protein
LCDDHDDRGCVHDSPIGVHDSPICYVAAAEEKGYGYEVGAAEKGYEVLQTEGYEVRQTEGYEVRQMKMRGVRQIGWSQMAPL